MDIEQAIQTWTDAIKEEVDEKILKIVYANALPLQHTENDDMNPPIA